MIGVIVNPCAGYVARRGVREICADIQEVLPDARVHVLQPTDTMLTVCRGLQEAGAEVIAAAGGDGTVGSVAAVLVGTATALGVIPAGTLNHFARDVGVGRDMRDALRVLGHRYVMAVDVASVNGHIFLNNSSIGVYARLVRVRERYERRIGKWRALVWAAWLVARRAHAIHLEVRDDHHLQLLDTYLLFVGNNQYELNLVRRGQRTRLDGGQLGCFTLDEPSRLQILPSVFHLLRDNHPHRRIFQSFSTRQLTVQMSPRRRRRPIEVACDGEVFLLRPPLVYRNLPQALKVVVPEPPPPGSREVREHG